MEFIKENAYGTGLLLLCIVIGIYLIIWLIKRRNDNIQASQSTVAAPPATTTPPATQNTTVTQVPPRQNTLAPGFKWTLFIISSVATVLICWSISNYAPNIWNTWFLSFAFFITIVSLALAIILKARGYKSSYWYWILFLILPISVSLLEFAKKPNRSNKGQGTVNQSSGPTMHNIQDYDIVNTVTIQVTSNTRYEVTLLESKSKVLVHSEFGDQIIEKDNLGVTICTPQRLDGNGDRVFILKKGRAKLKTWELY
jgi:hypothetical protein